MAETADTNHVTGENKNDEISINKIKWTPRTSNERKDTKGYRQQ